MEHLILEPKIEIAQIISGCHSDNLKNLPIMGIGMYDANKIYRVLFKISIDKLPENVEIVAAKLKLMLVSSGASSVNIITPYALMENWNLNTVTWYNQPYFDPEISGENVNVKREAEYIFDITSIVKQWYGDEIPNNGIILKNQETHCRTFAKIILDTRKSCGPEVEIIYKQKCSGGTCCTKFIDKCEELCTNDSYRFSEIRNTSLTKTVIFFVENLEIDEIKAHIQVSPDRVKFINEPTEILVGMDGIKFIVPCVFAKFTRVAVKNSYCGETSRVRIWYQAQE
ncbi:DNRLRE domain-containing protein [Clostridium sp.]